MTKTEQSRSRGQNDEVRRYREAAEATLNQVDWCIGYLYRIRKPEIARALERNRSSIRRRMGATDR
jgi:hypothetical protein